MWDEVYLKDTETGKKGQVKHVAAGYVMFVKTERRGWEGSDGNFY